LKGGEGRVGGKDGKINGKKDGRMERGGGGGPKDERRGDNVFVLTCIHT
jgi:hypothetical protein